MKGYAPVLVQVYNRLDTLKRCVEGLKSNPEAAQTDLYIVSDAAGRPQDVERVAAVRSYMHTIAGFREVHCIEHEKNMGAHLSIRETWTRIQKQYGRAIFMEDDIEPCKFYLGYLNAALDYYENDKRVFAICAHKLPFKLPRSYKADAFAMNNYCPWGSAFWEDRHRDRRDYDRYAELKQEKPEVFRWLQKHEPRYLLMLKGVSEGTLQAGDVCLRYHLLRTGQVCIFPRQTLTHENGAGADAVHRGMKFIRDERYADRPLCNFEDVPIDPDKTIYSRWLQADYPNLLQRVVASIGNHGVRKTLSYYLSRFLHRKLADHQ